MKRLFSILVVALLTIATSTAANAPLEETAGNDSVTFWGNFLYSKLWSSSGSYYYGVYSFSNKNPNNYDPIAESDVLYANYGGAFYEGVFHFVTQYEQYQAVKTSYYEYDVDTWQELKEVDLPDYSLMAMSAAYDPTTHRMFGAFYNADMTKMELASVSYEAMDKQVVAPTDTAYTAMAINKQGEVYAISAGGHLWKINKTTGDATLVGSLGVNVSMVWQSAAFDNKTGKLYWTGATNDGTAQSDKTGLYEINTTTGAATLLSEFKNTEVVTCLTVPEALAPDDAPAKPENLTVDFKSGRQSGTVSFDVPDTTFAGKPLSGSVTYYIIADGDTVKTATAAAGAKVSENVTVKNSGNVTFRVALENEQGTSPVARATTWVGNDTPRPVDSIKVSIDENNNVKLKWNRPSSVGANRGYVNRDDIRYQVLRYAGHNYSAKGVVVADELSDSTFTEQIGSDSLQSYCYGIKAYIDEKVARENKSRYFTIGKAQDVPYQQDFNSWDDFYMMTVEDADGNGDKWRQHNDYRQGNSAEAQTTYNQTSDDWLFTAPIALKSGHVYQLTYSAMASLSQNWGKYSSQFEVLMGKAPNSQLMTKVVTSPTTLINTDYKFQHFTAIVTVNEDGAYYIGFHNVTPYKDGCSFYLDSIKLVDPTTLGISSVTKESIAPSDVYNLNGVKVRSHATTLEGLKAGIYIIRNRKVVVK